MAGVPGWQDFLSCYREHFEVVRAGTPSLLDQVHRLRYQVYCVENDYEDPGRQAEGRETDIYDDRSVHALLIHRRSDAVAGTVRVILPGKDREPPLPINLVADCDQRERLRRLPHSRTAEISRFAVSKEFRQRCAEAEDRRLLRYITIGLIRGALEICRDKEIHYGCAVMERSLIPASRPARLCIRAYWRADRVSRCKTALCCIGQSDRVDGRERFLVAPRRL